MGCIYSSAEMGSICAVFAHQAGLRAPPPLVSRRQRRVPPPPAPARHAARGAWVPSSSSQNQGATQLVRLITLSFASSFGQCHAVFPPVDALDTSKLPTATFHATVRPAAILHAPAPTIPAGNITDRRHHMHHLFGRRPDVERGSGGGAVAVNGRVRCRCRQAVAVAGGRVYSCRLLMAHKPLVRHHKLCIIFLAPPPRSMATATISARRSIDIPTYTPEDCQAGTVASGWWRRRK